MKVHFIKDPVYGYITISPTQKDLLDSRPMQRLRRIRQLCGSDFVYVGATHCRFSHSLGVSYLAEQLMTNLVNKLDMDHVYVEELGLAGLLHDVGHGPFSHVFETILMNDLKKSHEDITAWLILESELAEILEKHDYNPKILSRLAIGKLGKKDELFLDQIISSTVDVDSMDYIIRDSHFSGAEYGFVDVFRLIYTMDVIEGNLAINLNALATLESFILARYESFKSIYFHKTSRAVQIMLEQALHLAKEDLLMNKFDEPEDYLKWDDYTAWTALLNHTRSRPIIEDISRRKLLKLAYEQTSMVKQSMFSSLLNKDNIRNQIKLEIAEEADVDPEFIYIDVPNLPTVPYFLSINLKPIEIPVFKQDKQGKKTIMPLTELSGVINVLRGYLNIVRVYTHSEYRDKVTKAAKKIFESSQK
ncbi:MAG: HD domain-containing protein [Candidatus Helarchaeales archaeon]